MNTNEVLKSLREYLDSNKQSLIATQSRWIKLTNEFIDILDDEEPHPEHFTHHLIYPAEGFQKGIIIHNFVSNIIRRLEPLVDKEQEFLTQLTFEYEKLKDYVLRHGSRNCYHSDVYYFGATARVARILEDKIKKLSTKESKNGR